MIAIFIVACFVGVLSLIAIQLYEQPNFGRKVLTHIGIVVIIIVSLVIFIRVYGTSICESMKNE